MAAGDLPNGSAEDIAIPGTIQLAEVFGAWGSILDDVITSSPTVDSVPRRVIEACAEFRPQHVGAVLYEARLRGMMLGALDVSWELESDRALPMEQADRDRIVLGREGPTVDGFATMPFDAAIDAFRSRRPVTRQAWDAMTEAQRRYAFTVAGDGRRAFVAQVQETLATTLREGVSVTEFRKRLGDDLALGGFTPIRPHHAETIFRTNLATAYGDGRRARMSSPEVAKSHPWWQIRCVLDRTTRKTHRAANGVTLPCTDPFWQRAYPPFGFRCRCSIFALRKSGTGASSDSFPQLAQLPDKGFTSSGAPIPPPEPPAAMPKKSEEAVSPSEAKEAHAEAAASREELPKLETRELPAPRPRAEKWPPGEALTEATRRLLIPPQTTAEVEARIAALIESGGADEAGRVPLSYGIADAWPAQKLKRGERAMWKRAASAGEKATEERVVQIAKLRRAAFRSDGVVQSGPMKFHPDSLTRELETPIPDWWNKPHPPDWDTVRGVMRPDGTIWVTFDGNLPRLVARGASFVRMKIAKVDF